MVRNMLEKIEVPNNSEMDACKCIFSNTNGYNFINAVAYLSSQVTEMLPNVKVKNKKKHRLLKVRTGQGRGIGRGHGRWKSDRRDEGS